MFYGDSLSLTKGGLQWAQSEAEILKDS